MRYLLGLVVVLCASTAFGQAVQSEGNVRSTHFATENWSKLGPATEGSKGFTLFGRDIRRNSEGRYELWIKVVPINTNVFNKRHELPSNVAFVLQHTTVDCDRKQLMFEKTLLYSSANSAIDGKITGLVPTSRKGAVRPGSIGESVYRNVCVDPTTVPKS